MSFGWSAGDIASAIKVVYNLIQALDDASGAANDYREAVLFLKNLLHTIEPLQQLALWNAYPDYGREIKEQVDFIQEPVKLFCAKVLKYESSLGATARAGSCRHVTRKLQWYLFMSQKVLKLKGKIESHMRLIDTLMQRLYLDLFISSQRELTETLRTTFERFIQPNLMTIIRDCQVPLSTTISDNYRRHESTVKDIVDSNMAELQKHISSEFAKFYKHQLNDLKNAQQNSISSLISGSNIDVSQSVSKSKQSSSSEPSPSSKQSFSRTGGALHTNATPSTACRIPTETRQRLSLQEM
ncbi:hypothetical protein CJF32_00001006 [Rutstroemia sp. NJR-2017a WRK4]|nr:hypothetical protein CJF32_00001006 [Rutstroemia sp. NJR-2017a WRK4]